ncbi:HAD-IIIA family hydrolase [bacterium]|nr:HAD-IIIA family hydrolase [bacterium]MCB2202224.1 HAD-IIIA family hydrolase [bacterium]
MNQRILVIRFSSLGDILLTSPVIVNLRIAFPHARIVFLTKERFREVVELFDGVDDVVTLPERASVIDLYRLLTRLDTVGFTHIVDLHGNQRSWLARKIVTADYKVVYPKRRIERRQMTARQNKCLPEDSSHTIDSYNEALRALGIAIHARRPLIPGYKLALPPRGSSPLVIIAPGAAHETKQWGLERFREVAVQLHRIHDAHIAWAVTSEMTIDWKIGDFLPADSLTELIDTPIPILANHIAAADLTIANDSGIAHLSSAVGTPVMALFGPTHPALGFAPRGLHDRVIDVDEFCRPCSLHGSKPCYRDKQYCFDRIEIDDVVAEASETLVARREVRPALFVDRDGTVIVEKEFLSDVDEVELEHGAAEALRTAASLGYRIVIVSNQSGVARGMFTTDTVDQINARMLELLLAEDVRVDAVYYCPYHKEGTVAEYAFDSDCRKPSPGMPEQAAEEFDIDLRHSIVVGDRRSDLELARTIGGRAFLVRTGYGREAESHTPNSISVFDSLKHVVDHLKRGEI